jgi:hypothetical protein
VGASAQSANGDGKRSTWDIQCSWFDSVHRPPTAGNGRSFEPLNIRLQHAAATCSAHCYNLSRVLLRSASKTSTSKATFVSIDIFLYLERWRTQSIGALAAIPTTILIQKPPHPLQPYLQRLPPPKLRPTWMALSMLNRTHIGDPLKILLKTLPTLRRTHTSNRLKALMKLMSSGIYLSESRFHEV